MSEYEGRLIVLDEAFGKNAIRKEFHPRKRERPQPYLHCTSAREAILAHLPDYRVAQILEDHGLVRYTPSMITDETELVAALENVRDRGFALNDQEHIQGIRAVGAPIRYNGEIVVDAVSLSGSASNWHGKLFRQELPEKVTGCKRDRGKSSLKSRHRETTIDLMHLMFSKGTTDCSYGGIH